jgi:hypothetical protein
MSSLFSAYVLRRFFSSSVKVTNRCAILPLMLAWPTLPLDGFFPRLGVQEHNDECFLDKPSLADSLMAVYLHLVMRNEIHPVSFGREDGFYVPVSVHSAVVSAKFPLQQVNKKCHEGGFMLRGRL